ncbi:hypothetical protein SAMN05216410_3523 [Sanguibacter gelidistatuariae]|uniref:SAF domain-containing protein n=1 Tax=Sanguibacter gelidistatuariae TaxID=1814289 RepID=A0A1G6VSC2_9MICO|nr:hypothetical protein [Sanguibacter gelidistatuariae]SDD56444.1 hypothetical protein SAMN05216410_3523 [Sanguibacter gelidistatuariae]
MTAELPAPVAPRLRRPTWRDPRLAFGILLVTASVALGTWAVADAGRTVAVYAAATTLTPGDAIGPQDLVAVDVRLGDDLDLYYPVTDDPPQGLVALRTVGERELLARSAAGSAEALDYRSVAIPVTETLSSKVTAGSTVDLWLVPPAQSGAPAAAQPQVLAEGLVVAELGERGSGLMAGGAPTVHVLAPSEALPQILAALAGGGTVAIMAVPGPDL